MSDKHKKALIIVITVIAIILAIITGLLVLYNFFNNNFGDNSQTVGFISSTGNEENDDSSKGSNENTDIEMIEAQNIHVNSYVIRTFSANNWNRINNSTPNDYTRDEDGNYVYDGYIAYSDNGIFVNQLLFNMDYDHDIIANLSVGAEQEEVIEALGEPSYALDNVYGYKTDTIYVFFYDDEVSVYPNILYVNNSLESFILEYIEGNYDGSQTKFIVEFRQNYEDFIVNHDGDDIVLTSLVRQIQIRLNGIPEETEVIIYNGYNKGNLIDENIGVMSNIVDNRTVDLVFETEVERALASNND